jgi:hypothetical protein
MRLRILSFIFPLAAFGLLHCGSSSGRSGFTEGQNDPNKPTGPGFDNGDAGKAPDATPVFDKCKVPPDGDNGGGLECTKSSPPNSFTPKIKWTWSPTTGGSSSGGSFGTTGSMVTPLVGNFTDDNGDGVIDLCDMPDVLVTTGGGGVGAAGKIYMLAGDTGQQEKEFEALVDASVNPAFGDLDGDGVPEIVANDPEGHIVVFDNEGKVKWRGNDVGAYHSQMNSYCHAIAIYDLDADGTPEIIAAFEVFDSRGNKLFGHDVTSFQGQYWCPANTAADLDGDGKLEVIFGNAAYHSDGSVFWTIPGPPGQPQVANLDGDPDPEIFVARQDGILVLDHDGNIKYGPLNLTGDSTPSPQCWSKPGAVHDFDGDGIADLSASTCTKYGAYKVKSGGLDLLWSATVDDTSGLASTTAFDFLGGGIAQAVYGDQKALYVFDGSNGNKLFDSPRSSGTLIEYPVVADIDNDQSADILVVSNTNGVGTYKHTIQAIEDEQKRWIPTRRVWNQHAYHVTNVREDGTIPKVMAKSWQRLNTFRTNAQIQGNGDCAPPPANPPK